MVEEGKEEEMSGEEKTGTNSNKEKEEEEVGRERESYQKEESMQ